MFPAAIDKEELKKKQAFSRWTSYVYLKNSDPNKYRSLNRNLQSQYALQNDQYPKTISKVTDVLTNHQWDNNYQELDKKIRTTDLAPPLLIRTCTFLE